MRQAKKNEKTRTKRAHPGRVLPHLGRCLSRPGRVLPAFFPQNFASANLPRVPLQRSPARVGHSCAVSDQVLPAQDSHVALARIFARASICLAAILVLSAFVLLAPHIQAESSSATIAVTIPIACSLGTDSSVHNYGVTVASGQVVSGIGGTRMSAYCNDNNGYTIYAIGASGGVDGNTNLINSTNPNSTIATGTTTSGVTSSWAMRLTPGSGTATGTDNSTVPTIPSAYQSYFAVPSTYTPVASIDSSTGKDNNASTTGNYITAEYQIYIGTAETPGTYLGRVKYAMLHPYTSGTPKDLETVLNEAYNAGILTDDDRITITTTDDGAGGGSGSGTGSGEGSGTGSGTGATTKTYYKMQSLTSTLCSAVNVYGEASQTQMIDERDNKIYWVTKLEDNHCWMTQNLDLDLISNTSADNYVALTSENTDLNEYGAHGYDSANGYSCSNTNSTDCKGTGEIITWTPERSTIAPNNLSKSTWTDDYYNPYSYDPGPDDIADASITAAGTHALTGNYYNWTATIASNQSNSFNVNTINNIVNNPKNSICPKSWRLPTISNATGYEYDSTNEFRRLNVLYNNNRAPGANSGITFTRPSLYLILAGYVGSGSLNYKGDTGRYWSSTIYYGAYAYYLNFNKNAVYPEYYDVTRSGLSVRCLLR